MTNIVLPALCGVATWTLLEYVIHRWLGHDSRFAKSQFGREHIRHHIEGDYFAPLWKKGIAAAVVTVVLSAAATSVVGAEAGISYIIGLMAFFGLYEVAHKREHTHPGITPYGRWARRHHFHHHFVDGRANFGVTSPVWDLVFGTYAKVGVIRVPRQLCMTWLLDPATADVRPEFSNAYEVRRAKAASSTSAPRLDVADVPVT